MYSMDLIINLCALINYNNNGRWTGRTLIAPTESEEVVGINRGAGPELHAEQPKQEEDKPELAAIDLAVGAGNSNLAHTAGRIE